MARFASSHHETDERQTVLVVDDTPENLEVIGGLLSPTYRVKVANSGERALRAADAWPYPDLILLDVMMPEMDGYEVMRQLKASPLTDDIPVIFVTALTADEDEQRGLELGAVDYVTKPVRPAILMARVQTHLELRRTRDWLRNQNGFLEAEVGRRMRENDLIRDVALYALATLAETRDTETGNHLYRTRAYVGALARHLRRSPAYKEELADAAYAMIVKATPLHDIGKVGIPDHILLKPGRLTEQEFAIMKTHAAIGGDAILTAMERVAADHSISLDGMAHSDSMRFLQVARQIARHHHERWDGTGYPDGLKESAIPLAARLMAVADVYDALICRRVYKEPMPEERVVAIITQGRGSHFDPEIVDAFLAIREEIDEIARKYADPEPRDDTQQGHDNAPA